MWTKSKLSLCYKNDVCCQHNYRWHVMCLVMTNNLHERNNWNRITAVGFNELSAHKQIFECKSYTSFDQIIVLFQLLLRSIFRGRIRFFLEEFVCFKLIVIWTKLLLIVLIMLSCWKSSSNKTESIVRNTSAKTLINSFCCLNWKLWMPTCRSFSFASQF